MSAPLHFQGGARSATIVDKVYELLKGFRTPFVKTSPTPIQKNIPSKETWMVYAVFIALCVVVIASMRFLENQTVRNWNVALFMILITYGYFQVSKALSVLMFVAFAGFYIYGGPRNEHLTIPGLGGDSCEEGVKGKNCRKRKKDQCIEDCGKIDEQDREAAAEYKKTKDTKDTKDTKKEDAKDTKDTKDAKKANDKKETTEHFEDPVTVREKTVRRKKPIEDEYEDEDAYEDEYEDEYAYEDDEDEDEYEDDEYEHFQSSQRRGGNDSDSDEEGIEQFGIEDTFIKLHNQIHETVEKQKKYSK